MLRQASTYLASRVTTQVGYGVNVSKTNHERLWRADLRDPRATERDRLVSSRRTRLKRSVCPVWGIGRVGGRTSTLAYRDQETLVAISPKTRKMIRHGNRVQFRGKHLIQREVKLCSTRVSSQGYHKVGHHIRERSPSRPRCLQPSGRCGWRGRVGHHPYLTHRSSGPPKS